MTEFVMPKLGITMEEGTVTRWLVKEGDEVKPGDPIVTVETDKAEVEVEAADAGVLLKILVPDGGTAEVGQAIALIGKPGEEPQIPSAPASASESEVRPAPARVQAPETPRKRPRISPLARKLAARYGLDIASLTGTGPKGRIVKRDIEAALVARQAAPDVTGQVAAAVESAPPASAPPASAAPAAAPAQVTRPAVSGRLEPLSRMRRVIAERMTYSVQTIPTFRITMSADLTATLELMDTMKPLWSRSGIKLTLTDFLIQAVAQSLVEHPQVNASFVSGPDWASSQIQYHDEVNIGLAVALPEGLLVPVLKGAASLSLAEIPRRRMAMVEAARAGKLKPDELSGGTFTISNLGAYGVEEFDAIINPPEAAILAVGQAAPKPVVRDGNVEVRTVMNLTLTCDHRVLDGAGGAEFLRSVVRRLERAEEYRLL